MNNLFKIKLICNKWATYCVLVLKVYGRFDVKTTGGISNDVTLFARQVIFMHFCFIIDTFVTKVFQSTCRNSTNKLIMYVMIDYVCCMHKT